MLWATLGYVAAPYSDQSQVQGSFTDWRAYCEGAFNRYASSCERSRYANFADGFTAPEVAQALPLTAKAVRQIAHRYTSDGLDAAVYADRKSVV